MSRSLALVTTSAEETRSLAATVAGSLRAGDVVALAGDLGAGKTTFVQGACAALGVDEPVLSPTFTLVRQYEGEVPVLHVDVYRLERLQDVLDLGFDEMVEAGGVVFVEWGDVIDSLLPESNLQVTITIPDEDDERRHLRVRACGTAWDERWTELAAAVGAWTDTAAAGEEG